MGRPLRDTARAAPLAPEQKRSLRQAVERSLDEHRGCDGTLRGAEAWARRENVPWRWLHGELEARGGFCDCEVPLNALE